MGFELNGRRYEYIPVIGERAVELAIAFDYVQQFKEEEYFEVGFVLAHHLPRRGIRKSTHLIVDKYEKHENYPNLLNVDIVDFVPSKLYRACFSISTLEHVGWDKPEERSRGKQIKAFTRMTNSLTEGGLLFVTVPLGYSKFLDEDIRAGRIHFKETMFMKQVGDKVWEQCELEDVIDIKYGKPFPAANGLLIGVNHG